MSWPKLKLESLAVKEPYSFVGGPFGSKLTTRDYVESGIPVIRGSNMNNGRYIDMADFVFVTESKVREDLSSNLAKPGDLIFTQRGTLGQVAIIPSDGISDRYVVSQSQMKLTVDKAKANGLFLYYFFSSREATERILSYVSSSGVPHINLTVMRNFEVPVPPIETQRGIARTLSAYDDLIENNRRRIQLLEQAARLLYKEWFVHLRFPGHEYARIIDGVPDGWEKKTAFEVMDVLSGGTPKTTNPSFWEGDIPFFTPKDVTDFAYSHDTEKSITEAGLKNCNSNLYPKDTVFITARGTVGKINLAQRPMAMNQSCYALVAHSPLTQQYLYFALVDGVEQFRSRAVGSVFDAIVRDTFKQISFVVPEEKLISVFMEQVSAMLTQIDNLSEQVRSLRKARDFLLPKLMSGEVSV